MVKITNDISRDRLIPRVTMGICVLTNFPIVGHICTSEPGKHWYGQCLVVCSPSHCLYLCWLIVNWTIRNNFQWNLNQNSNIFIQEGVFENVACEIAAIWSWGRWVKDPWACPVYITWRVGSYKYESWSFLYSPTQITVPWHEHSEYPVPTHASLTLHTKPATVCPW